MTKNEMLKMMVEGAVVTAEMAAKAQEMLAADAKAKEARKGKISNKELEKREANAKMAEHIAATYLTDEAKTASDIATALTNEMGEEIKVQKASYLCRLAVKMGLANEIEVKIPKKSTQKGYVAVDAVEAVAEESADE